MENLESFVQKFGGLTEEYVFYNGTVTLRYDVKKHLYLLVTPEGTLEPQDGVTTICHILDKSPVLLPWACKVMANKFLINSEKFYQNGWYTFSQNDLEETIRQAKSAHKEKLEDAGEVGHQAHAWVETHIKSCIASKDDDTAYPIEFPKEDDRVTSCCIAAITWMANHHVRWISTEKKVYSRSAKYAGTMDGLALVDSCDNPKCCKRQFKDHLSLIDWKTSNQLYVEYVLQTAAYRKAYEEETGETVDDIWIIRLGKTDAEFEEWHVDDDLAELGWDAFLKALWLSRSMAALNTLVDDQENERKAVRKAEKQVEKEANLAIKCKNASRYKGVRRPTCNDGTPCQTCREKYEQVRADRESFGTISPEVKAMGKELGKNVLQSLKDLLDK